jgi:hypothetical protein
MPSYLRIPEMTKRSAEFVLDLDILHRAIEKQYLFSAAISLGRAPFARPLIRKPLL